jgi:hypothetical protein
LLKNIGGKEYNSAKFSKNKIELPVREGKPERLGGVADKRGYLVARESPPDFGGEVEPPDEREQRR